MNESEYEKNDLPTERRVTLRDIAAALNTSHVTVSKALRNLSGVSEKMKQRITQKAEELGYVPDPLLSSLSSYRNAAKRNIVQSEIAWINTLKQPQEHYKSKEFQLYREGADDLAMRLGYRLQSFNTNEIPPKRLKEIFKTRNIQGVLLPPFRESSDTLASFDWNDLAVVRVGQTNHNPQTHFVSSAQVANTMLALDKTREYGYKRIGFVCEYWSSRYFGAGFFWAQKKLSKASQVPLLTLDPSDSFNKQQIEFNKWLQEHKPDAILTDNNETREMLINLKYSIPESIALGTTSIHDTNINAGIDQRPYEIGRAAIRMLVALITEKSFGLPECRIETLIEGNWVDGSMLPKRTSNTEKK